MKFKNSKNSLKTEGFTFFEEGSLLELFQLSE